MSTLRDLDELRSHVGKRQPPSTILVTRQDLVKFAIAIGAPRDIYLDVEAARRAGLRDVVAPPNYYICLGLTHGRIVPQSDLGSDGLPRDPILPDARIVAGETDVELFGNIFAGDEITVQQTLADVSEKMGRSGRLVFMVYERTYRNARGELLVRERYSRIAREPMEAKA